jgi:hypothetical protein
MCSQGEEPLCYSFRNPEDSSVVITYNLRGRTLVSLFRAGWSLSVWPAAPMNVQ